MQPNCSSARARLVAMLATLLLTVLCALARDGRDFAGRYSIHDVTEQGNNVRFTMHLTVMNNSDVDVKQALITLRQNTGIDLAIVGVLALLAACIRRFDGAAGHETRTASTPNPS